MVFSKMSIFIYSTNLNTPVVKVASRGVMATKGTPTLNNQRQNSDQRRNRASNVKNLQTSFVLDNDYSAAAIR